MHRVEAEGFQPFWAITRHADIVEIERQHEKSWNTQEAELGQAADIKTLIHMNGAQNGGCGLGSFALSETGSGVVLNPFGENGATTFTIVNSRTLRTSGLVIFSQPDHDCQVVCSDAAGLAVFCTNPRGGSCSQAY